MHIDTMQLPRFDAPGHWATGDRAGHRSRGAGTVHVVSVIDDHSRLAYCELHSAEDRWTTSATLRRAAAWMREQGCGPVQAVMSDNHKAYTSHTFTDARRTRRPPDPHPALHPALEREDRKVLRHRPKRVVTQPHLARLDHPRPGPGILHALLQPTATTLSRRRPSPHHPRPASPRAGHLIWPSFCQASSANGQQMRAFLLVGRGGGPGPSRQSIRDTPMGSRPQPGR